MIIVIIGPTGVGKTKLSVELAKKINAEIINADATQVYRDMNIATAKVTTSEMEGIKHHLVDTKDFTENYTIYDYQKDGREIIDKLQKENKNIIIVGGSALYIKALPMQKKQAEQGATMKARRRRSGLRRAAFEEQRRSRKNFRRYDQKFQ